MPWSLRTVLTLALASALFQWYVLRRTTRAVATLTGWPKKIIRITAAAVALWIALYPLTAIGSYYLGLGRVSQAVQKSDPLIDWLIIYPFWIGVILSVQLALFFLAIDAIRLALFTLYKKHKPQWLKVQSWLVILLVGIGTVYAIARVYKDTFTLRTTQAELQIPDLPPALEGFRIVQIADMQADARTNQKRLQAYVETMNSLKPDLVLFGGDLVTSGTDYIETGAAAMGRIEARHGVYACLGDHDHFSDRNLVIQALNRNGVTVLDNLAAIVPVESTYISLTGITNVYRTRPANYVLDTIEQQRLHGPINILLTHQPSPWLVSLAAEKGYDLFLAGHTHGGQIAFPLPGFLLTGSSFETDYVTGFYAVGSMLVSVNNGLGLTLAPVRYHAPAEVTLIVLRTKQ